MINKLIDTVGNWLGREDSEREKKVTYAVLSLIAVMLVGEIVRGWLI